MAHGIGNLYDITCFYWSFGGDWLVFYEFKRGIANDLAFLNLSNKYIYRTETTARYLIASPKVKFLMN